MPNDLCFSTQVVFEAVRGSDFRSDIALDDVTFKDGSCTSFAATTPTPKPEVVITPSPTKAPAPPGNKENFLSKKKNCHAYYLYYFYSFLAADQCNFGTVSGTLCTWINDPTNPKTPDDFYQFNWLTQVGPTPTSDTGPSSGHGGSGKLLLAIFYLSIPLSIHLPSIHASISPSIHEPTRPSIHIHPLLAIVLIIWSRNTYI